MPAALSGIRGGLARNLTAIPVSYASRLREVLLDVRRSGSGSRVPFPRPRASEIHRNRGLFSVKHLADIYQWVAKNISTPSDGCRLFAKK